MPSGMQHIIGIPPHIIIMGMPIFIMLFMRSQHSFIISLVIAPMGVILQTMLLPDISQVMVHIIGIIMPIIMGFIIGIMPPIIMGFIIGFWAIADIIKASPCCGILAGERDRGFRCY